MSVDGSNLIERGDEGGGEREEEGKGPGAQSARVLLLFIISSIYAYTI